MQNRLSRGARRWFVSGVAVPLSAKALDHIATRLERAEGRTTLSRGLRATAKVVGRRGGPSPGRGPGGASASSRTLPPSAARRSR